MGAAVTRQQERVGLVFAALCALNGALVPAVAKLTTERGAPLFVAMATTLFSAVVAALVLGIRGELPVLVHGAAGRRLAAIGVLGTGVAFQLFYAGASRSSAIETVLCLQIEPVYSLLAAWLVLGHRPTARRVAAICTLLTGIALAVGGRGVVPSRGVWLLLATPLCWQVSHLIVLRGLVGISPSVLTGARYVYGSAVLVVWWLLTGGVGSLPASTALPALLPLLAFQGVVLSYVGTLLWYQAVTRLDLARSTAIVVPSIPLLSLLASFLLLGEVATARQWTGLLLTAAGVLTFVTTADARGAAPPAPAYRPDGAAEELHLLEP
jgi:probable blue pigment (indigoidine) exporter